MQYRYILFIGLLGILYSCEPELEDYSTSNGNADFSTYVALGNSLTAGYADGALYNSAQSTSYPAILAQQFAKAGGGSFAQPVVNSEYGVFDGKLILGYSTDCLGTTSLAPVMDEGSVDGPAPVGYQVNNLGVPGAKSSHLLAPGYGTLNPYFGRFASEPMASVVGDAMAMNPTFFTLWIGNNDVLGYSTSGGVGDTITGQMWFAAYLNATLETLTSGGAKGAIANIPEVSAIPFFNTVPYNALPLQEQGQVDALNEGYDPYNQLMEANGLPYRINFTLGYNPLVIMDDAMPLPPAFEQFKFRQISEDELILLTIPQDSIKCAGWGSQVPVEGQYVLTETELDNIDAAITGYNQTISTLAAQYNVALVDMNAEFNKLKTGIISDGVTLNTSFITGNAFSLDGVHGTPMGYSHVANIFVNAINSKYGSTFPTVSITGYTANILP